MSGGSKLSLEAIGINQMNDDGAVNREVTMAGTVYILRVIIKEEEYQNWVRWSKDRLDVTGKE